jgi:hypothetical protein
MKTWKIPSLLLSVKKFSLSAAYTLAQNQKSAGKGTTQQQKQ